VTPEHPVEQTPQYTYDGHGNRTAITVPVAAQEPTEGGRIVKALDALANVPQPDVPQPLTTRYRYDGTHQLRSIGHANGGTSCYEYDALGRRTAKHVTDAGGRTATTLFVWDGDWMAQEIRAGDANSKPVIYVSHPDHAGPLTKLDGAKAYHYATDHLGTPQELYDEKRQIVWAADLSAYGKTQRYLKHEIDNPIRFPGQYFDAESGLHYNRFRYYDPQAGRYVNQDPIGLAGGSNAYSYASSTPNNNIDPFGLEDNRSNWQVFLDSIHHKSPKIVRGTPKNACVCTYKDKTFSAPPEADYENVVKAGQHNGLNPVAVDIAVGHYGRYDFQRNSEANEFIGAYTDASNFSVGAYMQGAGYSREQTIKIASTFANSMSKNAGAKAQVEYWEAGWDAAKSGNIASMCK
jgi:RHS repeat-associated protein